MNLLCKSDVAIVSEIAGTTRDIISNTLTLLGTSITLNDTAGLRKTSDKIEKMGIEKTIEMMNLSFIIDLMNAIRAMSRSKSEPAESSVA